ncbi:hypothetical protein ABQX22_19735 [Xanthomonas sp. WHRI 1810A]|uniref:hypothetical protein n=1 Tax=Xanthomonas sp. WHRI 1810A TaxID=3161565 RepID=UPI0032E8B909
MAHDDKTSNTSENRPQPRIGLAVPTVPGTDPIDGLLPVSRLGEPLKMHLVAWAEALSPDTYQLMWNGTPLEPIKIIGNDGIPGGPLTLDIPASLLIEGIHQAQYLAGNSIGGVGSLSPATPVIVDLTAPGGPLLESLIFPQHANALSQQAIAHMDGTLTARLPIYLDAKWGDVICTYWDEQPGPMHTVQAEELPAGHISMSFDQTFLEQLADGEVKVTYTVTDRAGNVSVVSQPAVIKLNLKNQPGDLLPPVVPQAQDGLIDNTDARRGVQVQIPSYTHAQSGDAVRVSWENQVLGEYTLTAEQAQQTPMMIVSVPYATLISAGDGDLTVNYQVIRDGQLQASSPDLKVKVHIRLPGPQDASPETLINEALATPVIKGKSDHPNREDNLLDEDDYLLNADAVIAWQETFKACDQINLFWGTCPVPIVHVLNQNDLDAARDVVMCVPNRMIVDEGVCKAINVRYTVTHPGNPNTAYSPSQSVRVICRAQLPGGEDVLAAPLFAEVDNSNTLTPSIESDITSLIIKPYRNMRVGDQVRISFAGFDDFAGGQLIEAAATALQQTVTEADLLQGIMFSIPTALLSAIQVGRAEARYNIENAYGVAHSLKADAYVDYRPTAPQCVLETSQM